MIPKAIWKVAKDISSDIPSWCWRGDIFLIERLLIEGVFSGMVCKCIHAWRGILWKIIVQRLLLMLIWWRLSLLVHSKVPGIQSDWCLLEIWLCLRRMNQLLTTLPYYSAICISTHCAVEAYLRNSCLQQRNVFFLCCKLHELFSLDFIIFPFVFSWKWFLSLHLIMFSCFRSA